MRLYVRNATGVPIRVTVLRPRDEPDVYVMILTGEAARPTMARSRKVFERVLRDGREAAFVPGVGPGSTLRLDDRLRLRCRAVVDGDGDRVLTIETFVN